jgi:hypothetical protein
MAKLQGSLLFASILDEFEGPCLRLLRYPSRLGGDEGLRIFPVYTAEGKMTSGLYAFIIGHRGRMPTEEHVIRVQSSDSETTMRKKVADAFAKFRGGVNNAT